MLPRPSDHVVTETTVGPAYITGTGSFLPGPPIGVDEVEDVLGMVEGKPSRLKRRILKANGIETRHYAIDRDHRTTHATKTWLPRPPRPVSRAPGCARATSACWRAPRRKATTCCPASAVWCRPPGIPRGRAGDDPRHLQLRIDGAEVSVQRHPPSRARHRAGREQRARVTPAQAHPLRSGRRLRRVDLQSEFLRWMLSDGAGAFLIESKPRGTCLRIDWIRSFSHADAFSVCMEVGRPTDRTDSRTWLDFSYVRGRRSARRLLIRQDLRLLDNILRLGVDGALRLIEEGVLDVNQLDHFLCPLLIAPLPRTGVPPAGDGRSNDSRRQVVHQPLHTWEHGVRVHFHHAGRVPSGWPRSRRRPDLVHGSREWSLQHGILPRHGCGGGMNAVDTEQPKRTLRRLMRVWFAFERRLAQVRSCADSTTARSPSRITGGSC